MADILFPKDVVRRMFEEYTKRGLEVIDSLPEEKGYRLAEIKTSTQHRNWDKEEYDLFETSFRIDWDVIHKKEEADAR